MDIRVRYCHDGTKPSVVDQARTEHSSRAASYDAAISESGNA